MASFVICASIQTNTTYTKTTIHAAARPSNWIWRPSHDYQNLVWRDFSCLASLVIRARIHRMHKKNHSKHRPLVDFGHLAAKSVAHDPYRTEYTRTLTLPLTYSFTHAHSLTHSLFLTPKHQTCFDRAQHYYRQHICTQTYLLISYSTTVTSTLLLDCARTALLSPARI